MQHDAQMDYYAKRLATCSSDATIKIFEVSADAQRHVCDLLGHEGPVWQVQWAHPKYGSVLASCGYDRKVIVWREVEGAKNQWSKVHVYGGHEMSVNSIAFCPPEYGLALACASSDGQVSLLTCHADGAWTAETWVAHKLGVNSVSFAPFGASPQHSILVGSNPASSPASDSLKLLTGGCDSKVKIWNVRLGKETSQNSAQNSGNFAAGTSVASLETTLEEHADWIRDAQWAPNIGLPMNTIATASQDGKVFIWTQEISDNGSGAWQKHALEAFNEPVWKVSWSLTGNILAVTSGDSRVTLWKEALDHQWKCISSPDDTTKTN